MNAPPIESVGYSVFVPRDCRSWRDAAFPRPRPLTLQDAFAIRRGDQPNVAACVEWARWYVALADIHVAAEFSSRDRGPYNYERAHLQQYARRCGDPNELAAIEWRLDMSRRALGCVREQRVAYARAVSEALHGRD